MAQIVRLLLDAGARTEARQRDGSTALMLAVQDDVDLWDVTLARLLLEFGADPDATRNDGTWPQALTPCGLCSSRHSHVPCSLTACLVL